MKELKMNDKARTPEDLLDAVRDRDSFRFFVESLIADREKAERMERDSPAYWKWGGANNWQNNSIAAFLSAGTAYFDHHDCPHRESNSVAPTWRDFAEFLYFGKIYE